MAPLPVNNPPEDWVSPAERRRLREANGHAENGQAVDDDPADATLVGDIVPRDIVVLGPAYNAAQGRDICRRVAAGGSLKQICGARGHPDLSTVMGWLFLDEVEVFTSQYLNARSARLELMMDEVGPARRVTGQPLTIIARLRGSRGDPGRLRRIRRVAGLPRRPTAFSQ